MNHITIIGGGITGLAAAYYLQREAQTRGLPIRYALVESGPRWGGKIITEREQGFTIEAGPDSFIVEKPAGLQLCHDVGLADALIPSNEQQKRVYVLRNGRMVPFPHGFLLTLPTEWGPFLASRLISPLGKLRMASDLFLPPRKDTGDESLGDFVRRRFGRECLDRLAGPLLGGIYVSDPDRLSMHATFPRLSAMEREHGSLIRAARGARQRPPPSHPAPRAAGKAMFNSLRSGMGSLVERIVRHLNGELRLNTPVARVSWQQGRPLIHVASGDAWSSDAVLLANPAGHAAQLLTDSAPELSRQLSAIRYVSTATLTLAYRASDIPPERPLDGFGVLIPEVEQRSIIALTWASTKFPHRAPDGLVLLRAFLGGYRNEALAHAPEDDLLGMVRRDLSSIMGIRAEPVLHKLYRWPHANPQYDVGHLDLVARIESEAARLPGLHLAGSSYRGVGIPDCIASARQAVARILASLTNSP